MASIEISIICQECGSPLAATLRKAGKWNQDSILDVAPCEKCMARAKDEGFEEGKESES